MSAGDGLRKRRRPEAKLPAETVDDTSISFRALGILLWIMSKPDGWQIRSEQMASDGRRADGTNQYGRLHQREGRGAIRTALLDELAVTGYYKLERRRLRSGKHTMGTAASEDPVPSWAAQRAVFGRKNPVPVIEQEDGSFLVEYPDGTLLPDDVMPPEHLLEKAKLEAKPPPAKPRVGKTAGQTGDRKPVPGESATPKPGTEKPAPVQPAPVNPATGEAATGNWSPLLKEEVRGEEVRTPPSPPGGHVPTSSGVQPEEGGDSSQPENPEPDLDQIVAWFAARKVAWGREAIRDALVGAVTRELGTLAEAAQALREIADGVHDAAEGPTDSPRRLYARPNAAWWSSVRDRRVAAAEARRRAGKRCSRRGHERSSADGCALCRAEAKSRSDDTSAHPAARHPDPDRIMRRYGAAASRS